MVSPATRLAAQLAPSHPALRWTPRWDPANRAQHARRPDGAGTRCGINAVLVPAETTDARCVDCFPA